MADMIASLFNLIALRQREVAPGRALLVGISGIDASGKGFISAKVAELLNPRYRMAVVNVDGWLNLPQVRFDPDRPAENFYERALRLDEMFDQLIGPLIANRSVKIRMDLAEETSDEFRLHQFQFDNIDIVVLEGIFIFKRKFIELFDLRVWIDCSFETALERAINRSQEGLSAEETARAYENIYFPAQRLHFQKDQPREFADIILAND